MPCEMLKREFIRVSLYQIVTDCFKCLWCRHENLYNHQEIEGRHSSPVHCGYYVAVCVCHSVRKNVREHLIDMQLSQIPDLRKKELIRCLVTIVEQAMTILHHST